MPAVPGDIDTEGGPPTVVPLAHFVVALGFLLAGVLAGVGRSPAILPPNPFSGRRGRVVRRGGRSAAGYRCAGSPPACGAEGCRAGPGSGGPTATSSGMM